MSFYKSQREEKKSEGLWKVKKEPYSIRIWF